MTDWQPGDPLVDQRDCYHRRLYDLIDLDASGWSDAATWPDPGRYDLGKGDEIAAFLARLP